MLILAHEKEIPHVPVTAADLQPVTPNYNANAPQTASTAVAHIVGTGHYNRIASHS